MVILIDPAQVPHNRYFERIEPLFAALRRRILKETALIYPKIIMVIIMQPHRWDKTLRWREPGSNHRSRRPVSATRTFRIGFRTARVAIGHTAGNQLSAFRLHVLRGSGSAR